eukprot:1185875-Prorocentrum_minimum.AAC.1
MADLYGRACMMTIWVDDDHHNDAHNADGKNNHSLRHRCGTCTAAFPFCPPPPRAGGRGARALPPPLPQISNGSEGPPALDPTALAALHAARKAAASALGSAGLLCATPDPPDPPACHPIHKNSASLRDPSQQQVRDPSQQQVRDPSQQQVCDPSQHQVRDPSTT